MIKFYSSPEKEKYWTNVQKKIAVMNEDQLVSLYNIHTDRLLKSIRNDDRHIKHYKTFHDLTYKKVKRYTAPANYAALMQLIDLILAGYNYKELYKILFDVDLDDEDYEDDVA